MKIKSELLFPAELTPGDEIWDAREGTDSWARVVAICSGNQELLVWCDAEQEPRHLPAAQRVRTNHVVADHMVGDDESATTIEASQLWYGGDLEAARTATAAHRRATEERSSDDVKAAKRLKSWYAGDLSYVLHNTQGTN